jgi:signal transduction histidine kinase
VDSPRETDLLDRFERGVGLSVGGLMTFGAGIILIFAFAAGHWVRVASLLLILCCGIAGSALVLRNRTKPGFLVLVLGAWLGSVGGMFSGGGISAPVSIVFPVLIFFAAWIGAVAVVAFSAATIAVFAGLSYASAHELLPVRYVISPYQGALVQSVILCGSAALGYFASRSLRGRLERLTESRRQLAAKVDELYRAQQGLEDVNARLEREVAERTRAEREILELNRSLEQRVAARTGELHAALKELESFNYSISHDLRSPLRSIAGYIGILRSDYGKALSGEPLPYFERIERSVRHMSHLIDDLLALSKAGRVPLTHEPVAMRELVNKVLVELLPERDGQPRVNIGDLPVARGDAVLLHQVWQNLIENAVKFSSKVAKARIEIGGAQRNGQIEYWVRDNGAGFDMTYADKLFGVFQRLHGPSEFEGTGIGLATVKRIVERHGGTVSAEGRVNEGAEIRFSLPAD